MGMGLITQVFLFYLDYLCSWQSMLAIACQIVFFHYGSTRCEELKGRLGAKIERFLLKSEHFQRKLILFS